MERYSEVPLEKLEASLEEYVKTLELAVAELRAARQVAERNAKSLDRILVRIHSLEEGNRQARSESTLRLRPWRRYRRASQLGT